MSSSPTLQPRAQATALPLVKAKQSILSKLSQVFKISARLTSPLPLTSNVAIAPQIAFPPNASMLAESSTTSLPATSSKVQPLRFAAWKRIRKVASALKKAIDLRTTHIPYQDWDTETLVTALDMLDADSSMYSATLGSRSSSFSGLDGFSTMTQAGTFIDELQRECAEAIQLMRVFDREDDQVSQAPEVGEEEHTWQSGSEAIRLMLEFEQDNKSPFGSTDAEPIACA